MKTDLPKRKNPRLESFDYDTTGAYFITICTLKRNPILSNIIIFGDNKISDASYDESMYKVDLLPHGEVAENCIKQLDEFYKEIEVADYIIMPDHIHILLHVVNTSEGNKQYTKISNFVSTFKRFCNKEYGYNIWQRSFHDHIIRNRKDYEKHIQYIYNNPLNWENDILREGLL